jgi:hypothetical protein
MRLNARAGWCDRQGGMPEGCPFCASMAQAQRLWERGAVVQQYHAKQMTWVCYSYEDVETGHRVCRGGCEDGTPFAPATIPGRESGARDQAAGIDPWAGWRWLPASIADRARNGIATTNCCYPLPSSGPNRTLFPYEPREPGAAGLDRSGTLRSQGPDSHQGAGPDRAGRRPNRVRLPQGQVGGSGGAGSGEPKSYFQAGGCRFATECPLPYAEGQNHFPGVAAQRNPT